MAIGNNIYPPIVTPYSPNFLIGQSATCRIYFSISAYNSIDEYVDAHLTITRQDNNRTALKASMYPSQIKIFPMILNQTYWKDDTRTSDDKYYIQISNDDIENGFQTGIVYKIQMRFSKTSFEEYNQLHPPVVDPSLDPNAQQADSYLAADRANFSEWSQVSLVQGINRPVLEIKNGKGGTLSSVDTNYWNVDTFEIVGTAQTDTQDLLRQYTLSLYNSADMLVETSGVLFPPYQSSENQINYIFKHALQDGETYTLKVDYMTNGLYEGTETYPIFALLNLIEQLDAFVTSIEDTENGRIGLHIQSNSIAPFAGKITIRRTSSKTDFEIWEDVHTIELRMEKLDYLWYDYTIESGVWYKYCIQKRDIVGNRGVITKLENPVMLIFDSIFLNADETQIKIKFDPAVSSFQRVVSDSKVDTIGSKYPYITRNGATGYREFPLSGLITFLMDKDKIFTSREDLYNNETIDLYESYNDENRIDIFNDITYERDFRHKVMDFLYKHNVKLYRSATAGNILVKLTNITFTPNQTLGRRIYSFQCTATEVDDCTITNIDKYNIQALNDPGNTGEVLSYEMNFEGQWDSAVPANTEFVHLHDQYNNAMSILEEYYNTLERKNYILSVDHLDYLRIEMYDKPYLIYETSSGPKVYNPDTDLAYKDVTYLGYLAYIDFKGRNNSLKPQHPIVIPADGIYELKGDNIEITSLQFAKDTNAEIRYHAVVTQTEDVSKILSLTTFTQRIGQEWGTFIPGDGLYQRLWNKYYTEVSRQYYQALVSINGVRVEANPGTVVYVREFEETLAERHMIGPTESLDFYDPDSVIGDVYFAGRHFEPATEAELERETLPEGKCYMVQTTYDNLDHIENPQEHYVYHLIPSNTNAIPSNDVNINSVPSLATIITVKGLPAFFVQKDGISKLVIDIEDVADLQEYLEDQDYEVYTTPSILNTSLDTLKTATELNGSTTFDFVIDSNENKKKIEAFKIILEQYQYADITAALKRQIWNDVAHLAAGWYIYDNGSWYVFDEINMDAVCPVPASIDYICEIMKGTYRS